MVHTNKKTQLSRRTTSGIRINEGGMDPPKREERRLKEVREREKNN